LANIATALTVTGALVFAIIVGWLHVERSDLSVRHKGISHYAVGRTYAAMTAAFVALAVGLLSAVAATIERIHSADAIGLVALGSAAVGLLVVAAVPVSGETGAVWRELVHTVGAVVFFVASAVGTSILSTVFAAPAGHIANGLVALVALFFIAMVGAPGLRSMRGWLQRGCIVMVVAWLIVVGWQFAS
jgi:hypothetical protein